jgi:hypothetical protein
MKKMLIICCAGILLPFVSKAQFSFIGYAEAGYQIETTKSEQLLLFTKSYNDYETTQGLTTPFPDKIPAAHGTYMKFGLGIGGPACKMILDFGILKMETDPMSARFSDQTGRDISIGIRNSTTDVGIRFGGTDKFPVWGQFDMNIGILNYYIFSRFVFADGSRSLGAEHGLNGIYTDFTLAAGIGLTVGAHIYGPLNVFAHADILPNFNKQHPEYHEFEDLQEFKEVNQYLPNDMASYAAGNNYQSENGITDDFKGKHFSFGIQLQFGK